MNSRPTNILVINHNAVQKHLLNAWELLLNAVQHQHKHALGFNSHFST